MWSPYTEVLKPLCFVVKITENHLCIIPLVKRVACRDSVCLQIKVFSALSKIKPLMKKTDCGCLKILVGHGKKYFPRKKVWRKLCFTTIKSVTCKRMTETENGKKLYKTSDGGRTWLLLQQEQVEKDNKLICTVTKSGFLWGIDGKDRVWKMNVRTDKIEEVPIALPEGYCIDSPIQTDDAGNALYMICREKQWGNDCKFLLYNLDTGNMIKVKFPIGVFSVCGDYIGVVSWERSNEYKNRYYYSKDRGKTWHKEYPPGCSLLSAYAVSGEGRFWSITEIGDDLMWPLMIRVDEKE